MTDYTPSEMKMNLRQLEKKLDNFRHRLARERDKDQQVELQIAINNGESEARMWRVALGLPINETSHI